jgi:hypothetical protein
MLSANDKMTRGVKIARVTGTDPFVSGAGYLLAAQCNGGSAAGVLSIFDATATSGTADIIVNAVINGGTPLSLGPNGWRFGTALHASITGTGASAYLFYIAE